MSKKFVLLMQKVKLVTGLPSKILEDQLAYRTRRVGRGDNEDPIIQKKAEALMKSIEARIPYLTTLLPIVENGKKYQSIGEWQKKLDAAFDKFLKSYLLPDAYFRSRSIDLDWILTEWNKVLADEGELDRIFKVVAPFRSQVQTGKTRKAERKTGEERRIETLNQDIQKLKDDIGSILEVGSRIIIRGKSKEISLKTVSDWQKNWKEVFSNLLNSNRNSEDLKSALTRLLGSMTVSGEMVEKTIIPAEQELSQIKYWLNYISTSDEVDRKRLDVAGVQKFQRETEEILTLFLGVPEYWVRGDLNIEALEKTVNFLDVRYDDLVIIVDSVLKAVNWRWFPGYNNEIEEPFLFESKSHAVKGIIFGKPKDGVYPSLSPKDRPKQIP